MNHYIKQLKTKITLLSALFCLLGIYTLSIKADCSPKNSEKYYTSGELWAVTYGNGKFVIVGTSQGKSGSTGVVYVSEDAKAWTPVFLGGGALRDVTWGGEQFIAVGYGGLGEDDWVIGSSDGDKWATVFVDRDPSSEKYSLNAIHWTGNSFVGAGYKGILMSNATGSWEYVLTRESFPDDSHSHMILEAVSSNKSGILVGGPMTELFKLEGGKKWVRVSDTGDRKRHFSILWNGNHFISTSFGGKIQTSVDGSQWETLNTQTNHALLDIAWTGTHYIAVGVCGVILLSNDAKSWELVESGTSNNLRSIAWDGKRYVVVGHSIALTSEDGKSWKKMNLENLPLPK